MGRGPRVDPVLYYALTGKIQSLAHTAARLTIPPGTNPTTMKNRILRAAADLKRLLAAFDTAGEVLQGLVRSLGIVKMW
jgi:hypothetical protein